MQIYLYLIICLFVIMLLTSVYFRVRVIKNYKLLKKKGVEFNSSHFFNDKKMKAETLPKHPNLKKEITSFVRDIKLSVTFSTILIALIFTFAWIIKRNL